MTTTTLTRLQHGEALHLPLDARTTLQVTAGRVVVRQPLRWLGETVVVPVVTLGPGQRCRLEQGGWVELEASEGAAELLSQRPASLWHALWHRLKHSLLQPQKEPA